MSLINILNLGIEDKVIEEFENLLKQAKSTDIQNKEDLLDLIDYLQKIVINLKRGNYF